MLCRCTHDIKQHHTYSPETVCSCIERPCTRCFDCECGKFQYILKKTDKLTIAIDYDNTFSALPDVFVQFIKLVQQQGHNCIIVTARSEQWVHEVHQAIGDLIPIYCTNRTSKRAYMDNLGVVVDIWIDDAPQWIV